MGLQKIFLTRFTVSLIPARFGPRVAPLFSYLVLCGCLSALAQESGRGPAPAVEEAATTLSAGRILADTRFLSSDLLEGRAPATRGDLLARQYVAARMEAAGLKPGAADGSFFQRVPLLTVRTDPGATLTVRRKGAAEHLRFGPDFVAFPGLQQTAATLDDAELVFVGYGIIAPEEQWDDFKDTDLRGKVLLFLNNDPDNGDSSFFGGKARLFYGRWTYKFAVAAERGAAGAFIIHTTPSAGYGWNVVESSWGSKRSEPERNQGAPGVPVKGWTSSEATGRILRLAGHGMDELSARAQRRDFRPVPLGVTVSTALTSTVRRLETANVLGLLPGSDDALRREAVIVTAHIDHLGIGRPVKGDSIYNGALDNAAGVASMLELARAFAALPVAPRRSLLFIGVAAEESGLIGSGYYADNPTFPPGAIAANINIDGINIFGPTRDIVVVGRGRSTLDAAFTRAAARQGRVVRGDPFPEQGSFYRSDQFSFARIGVPSVAPDGGTEYVGRPQTFAREMVQHYIDEHYHQPSDEIDTAWNLTGAVQDLALTLAAVAEIADAPSMPAWNPGDEFEAVRRKALRDAGSRR